MKLIPYLIVGLTLTSTSFLVNAQDKATPAAVATPAEKSDAVDKVPKKGPFRGTVSGVDASAATFTITNKVNSKVKTYTIAKEATLTRAGNPATLADVQVGDYVRGSALKEGDDKYQVFSAKFGEKTADEIAADAEKKAKKDAKKEAKK